MKDGVHALIREYLTFAFRLSVAHGVKTATKVLKDLDSRTKLVVAGQRVPRQPFGGVWLKTSSNGLPKELKCLRLTVVKFPLGATQVTSLVRLVLLTPSTDISTITSPNTSTWPPVWLEDFRDFTLKIWPHPVTIEPRDTWHTSTKAGPNGPAAVFSAGIDAIANAMSPGTQALFEQGCQACGMDYLLERYRLFIDSIVSSNPLPYVRWPKQITGAKLAFLSDKAGKTRVVYILSYWWQELLKPLHDAMFNWLRHQPQDGTFDQRKVVETVRKWTSEGKPLWSYDLTAATDRWPKDHQAICVERFGGRHWMNTWRSGLGISPFVYPLGTWTFYAVGQPMGAYASWAALAFGHHALIRWCASRAGRPWDCYVVLGDDVVIADRTVASLYKQALTDLGVTISEAKSVVWENQITGSSAEFAKQILRDGQDLSPFSPALLKEIWDDHQWWKVLDLLQQLKDRIGPVAYKLPDDNLWLPAPTKLIWQTFNKSVQAKLAVLISDPQGPRCLISEVKEDLNLAAGLTIPNPWAGIENLTYLTIKSQLVTDKLFEDTAKLMKLRDDLKEGRSGSKLRGWLTELEGHPIWAILDRLDEAVLHMQRYVTTGDTSLTGDFTQIHMDVGYLSELMVKGVTYNEWKDQKSRRLKVSCNFSLQLHRKIRLLDAPTTESDWSDW